MQGWEVTYSGWWESDGGGSIEGRFFSTKEAAADGIISSSEMISWEWSWSGNDSAPSFMFSSEDDGAAVNVFSRFYVDGTPNRPSQGIDQGSFTSGSRNELDLETLQVTTFVEGVEQISIGDREAVRGSIAVSELFDGNLDGLINFDPAQYLASHRDLINAFGYDLAAAENHYQNFGILEGRDTDLFDEVRYVASYGDLIAAFGLDFESATAHYINHGANEGRVTDLFEPISYLNNNSDLRAAFGGNLYAAALHYIQFGFFENRVV